MGGLAWIGEGKLLGYLPLRVSGHTLVVGRMFASRCGPTEVVEADLLDAAIHGAFSDPLIQGISGELLKVAPATLDRLLSGWPGQVRLRLLMEVTWIPSGDAWNGSALEPWHMDHLVPASGLLRRAYAEVPHFLTDPALNVQEVTVRLLERIITHPICGTFEPGASFVARAPESGHLLGFVLASRMGADQGHVSEVAVDPDASQRGIGKALVTKALDALQKLGCRTSHLAVDQDNFKAIGLYKSLGFLEYHRFPDLRLERGARDSFPAQFFGSEVG
jgi:GNAT superfamily N-acetyltransferase